MLQERWGTKVHMIKTQLRAKIQNNWPLYLAAVLVTLIMRYFARTSDTDVLKWILAPTAGWAGILGGISFEYMPHQGYVNHGYQFLIAAACSGCRFMLLTFLMLVFMPESRGSSISENVYTGQLLQGDAVLHEPHKGRKDVQCKCRWLVFCITLAYLFTIFVNGIRIVLAIRLPILLDRLHLFHEWLTPDRLHTLIGTVVYFTALCVLYLRVTLTTDRNRLFVPVFWYLSIVLLLPFAKRLWYHEWTGFGEYAVSVAGACIVVWAVVFSIFFRKASKN